MCYIAWLYGENCHRNHGVFFFPLDLDDVTDEKMKELCTGSHVFFNCLGTTRAAAGSAVRHDTVPIACLN